MIRARDTTQDGQDGASMVKFLVSGSKVHEKFQHKNNFRRGETSLASQKLMDPDGGVQLMMATQYFCETQSRRGRLRLIIVYLRGAENQSNHWLGLMERVGSCIKNIPSQ